VPSVQRLVLQHPLELGRAEANSQPGVQGLTVCSRQCGYSSIDVSPLQLYAFLRRGWLCRVDSQLQKRNGLPPAVLMIAYICYEFFQPLIQLAVGGACRLCRCPERRSCSMLLLGHAAANP